MPRIVLPTGPRLWTRILRRAAELWLTRAAYLRKLVWRDIGQAAEEKAKSKLRQRK
jgi:hypothetical protein